MQIVNFVYCISLLLMIVLTGIAAYIRCYIRGLDITKLSIRQLHGGITIFKVIACLYAICAVTTIMTLAIKLIGRS